MALRSTIFCLCVLFASLTAVAEEEPVPFRFSGGEKITINILGMAVSSSAGMGQSVVPTQLVTSDGLVSVPGVGSVFILGKTLREATDIISDRIKSEMGIRRPMVSIGIMEISSSNRVYVQGEVLTPKSIELPAQRDFPLSAALAEAGGTTKDADISRIKVIHANAKDSPKVEIVDTSRTSKTGNDLGPILNSGDVVIVPASETYVVLGEVMKAGMISRKDTGVPSGSPIRLTHIIGACGGIKPSADKRSVRLIRTEGGRRRVMTYDYESATERGAIEQDPVMQDGDQVLVTTSEGILILGGVRGPGLYYSVGAQLSLTRLVALAGGFNPNAKKNAVVVVRKDRGDRTMIDMRAIVEEGQLQRDVLLSPGDMVFVGESSL